MGIFDDSKSKQIAYLEEERKKLWERVAKLQDLLKNVENEVSRRTSDDEKEAKQHSKKAAEFRNRAEQRLSEIEGIISSLNEELDTARKAKNEVNNISAEAVKAKGEIDEALSRIEDSEIEYKKKLTIINSKISTIDLTFEKYPDLEAQLEKLIEFSSSTEENLKKSTISLSSINKRKEEIDDLHREIFGYSDEDESGEEIVVEGLKGELEKSYEGLKENIEGSFKNVDDLNNNYENKYKKFEEGFKKRYQKINEDIAALMPAALTAGLSSAFSKKKEDEVDSSKSLQQRFTIGIVLMIIASLIPVIISIVFLSQGISLEEVINRLPRLVLAIVPIYVPILWFTYSANKKLNLSKRLIEEYAHKEVLSRTYEGLSTQIESINDQTQSEELRLRLLSNFLQVSSENPGKLISNYEASDHPVMEALEQSYKFQMAIDRLGGVPGLGKVAAILERNAKKKIDLKTEKIEEALTNEDGDDDNLNDQ